MQIASSAVALNSSQINLKTTTKTEHLRIWDKNSDSTIDESQTNGTITSESYQNKDKVSIDKPVTLSIILPGQNTDTQNSSDQSDQLTSLLKEYGGDLRTLIMKEILEAFTGQKMNTVNPDDITASKNSVADTQQSGTANAGQQSSSQSNVPDWGIDFSSKETTDTKEGTDFSGAGTVTTADGQKISFKVSLQMVKDSQTSDSVSVKAGAATIDPLMVDFSGNGVSLTNAQFSFDLDGNGQDEQISAPSTGSGFLVYDKNGNGVADNGTELFGPSTGNGFNELAQLDSDHNGWIDQNDPAYNQLKVWTKDANGNDQVESLAQSGIGAIYTKGVQTQFTLPAGQNPSANAAGILTETGVAVKEDGGTALVQNVDFVV